MRLADRQQLFAPLPGPLFAFHFVDAFGALMLCLRRHRSMIENASLVLLQNSDDLHFRKATALHVLIGLSELLAELSSSMQAVAVQNYNLAKESFFA